MKNYTVTLVWLKFNPDNTTGLAVSMGTLVGLSRNDAINDFYEKNKEQHEENGFVLQYKNAIEITFNMYPNLNYG